MGNLAVQLISIFGAGTFTWPLLGSLAFGTLLNSTVSFWCFVWYKPLEYQFEPQLSAHQTTLDTFFYVWLILGWGMPVLAGLEWVPAFGREF